MKISCLEAERHYDSYKVNPVNIILLLNQWLFNCKDCNDISLNTTYMYKKKENSSTQPLTDFTPMYMCTRNLMLKVRQLSLKIGTLLDVGGVCVYIWTQADERIEWHVFCTIWWIDEPFVLVAIMSIFLDALFTESLHVALCIQYTL